jgi:hypothetical protein
MSNEFVPYDIALALKELGFGNGDWFSAYTPAWWFKKDKDTEAELRERRWFENDAWNSSYIPAPLYQQAFRWFREKYKLDHSISTGIIFSFTIDNKNYEGDEGTNWFNTYEEAELACLRKLIEICQEKN